MTAGSQYLAYLRDLLAPLGPVEMRRMFGGAGAFLDDAMFGLIADETLYFKTDDANRADFENAGMAPFTYERAGKRIVLSFHQVPADVMEDPDQLEAWARRAWEAARRNRRTKRNRRS